MKIALVGYKGSGKSTLFEWLTGTKPDPALSHTAQSVHVPVPDKRLEALQQIYQPKKVTAATLEIVDTPGLERTHEGNAARLALIREAGCLVLVIGAFNNADPARDYRSFEEDLLLADMAIVSGRIERIETALKKPHPKQEREKLEEEREALTGVLAAMESGKPLQQSEMNEQQLRATRSFRLLTEKPRMVILSTSDTTQVPDSFRSEVPSNIPVLAIPAALELELAELPPEERQQFIEGFDLGGLSRDDVLRILMDAAGQMLFFTVSQKEVRSWMIPKGSTALEAAGTIHTDMAKGFIRAEVMTVSDLVRLGSEREVKANNLVRHEPKDYIVQDDDILFIRFSV